MIEAWKSIEGFGYVYFDYVREDVLGYEHVDDGFCIIETKDGHTIDIASLVSEFFGVGCNYCGYVCQGDTCEVEERGEECPYKDENGICRPPLFWFKISKDKNKIIIEAERSKDEPTKCSSRLAESHENLEAETNAETFDVLKETPTSLFEASISHPKKEEKRGNVGKEVFIFLTNALNHFGDVIHRSMGKYHYFYKRMCSLESIFAVATLSKGELVVRIRFYPEIFRDPKGLIKKVNKKWFFTKGRGEEGEIRIQNEKQLDYAISLIRQSYEIAI